MLRKDVPKLRGEYLFAFLLLLFWLVIYMLSKILPLKKYGLHIKPFFIKYESKAFKKFLYKYSGKWKILWRFFSYINVFLGLGLMIFSLIFLLGNVVEMFLRGVRETAVVPIIPGFTLSLYWLPYFLIGIIVAVFTHEAAHGIIALIEGIQVKSAGAFVLAIFPGGFVEIDERELERLPYTSRIKIFSAGVASNILCGLLVFLIISLFFIQTPSGIVVLNVLEGGPLDVAGIGRWDVIYALNGTPVHTLQDLVAFMTDVKPGERLVVSTSRGNITIVTASSPENASRAIIGIVFPSLPYYPSRLGLGFFWDVQIYLILSWLFIVLVNIAIFNMLPIPLLDGDKFIQCLLEKFADKGKLVKKFFNLLSLFLIVINMALSL
ncbi:site-2 protease family protein [Candidatus Bathyarchaeota archaeon]|nr:site-2 protease family protein [Candidatus Bathyarchaeota archaeon]